MKLVSPSTSRRMPAEWETYSTVLLAWPHPQTDWATMLPEVQECYHGILRALKQSGMNTLIVGPDNINIPTNDTWTRDYGPITVQDSEGTFRLLDFKFNGWGLKFAADLDNQVVNKLSLLGHFPYPYEQHKDWVLEGGSIETDGHGTILTTSRCLLSINRNGVQTRQSIEHRLAQYLGARRVLWLEHGALEGDDTDSHIDTLARFAPNDTILYVKAYDTADSQFHELEAMEEQLRTFRTLDDRPYNLIGLPLPEVIYDDAGQRLPATYANFLITPAAVLMPTYDQPRLDRMAAQMLQIAFCDREIIPVDCRALIKQHGSLHCSTMQLP